MYRSANTVFEESYLCYKAIIVEYFAEKELYYSRNRNYFKIITAIHVILQILSTIIVSVFWLMIIFWFIQIKNV